MQTKVAHISKGARILTEWIGFCVEYKLKHETLLASKRKIPDLEDKIKTQMSSIDETNGQLHSVEKKIEDLHQKLVKSTVNIDSLESRINTEDMSIISINSNHIKEDNFSQIFTPRFYQVSQFPNFGSDQLYGDTFVSKVPEEEMEIKYEGPNELVGCCRTRFFCF